MPTKPTASLVNQKIDDHVGACADRYEAIDRRLYRIEAIMIGASASSIGLLLKIAFT
jgi:hypothetical protein